MNDMGAGIQVTRVRLAACRVAAPTDQSRSDIGYFPSCNIGAVHARRWPDVRGGPRWSNRGDRTRRGATDSPSGTSYDTRLAFMPAHRHETRISELVRLAAWLAGWFEWVRWVGVAYLLYLGIRQWIAAPVDLTRTYPPPALAPRHR